MAKFLTQAEVYRIIQRELPPECYPDGPPSGFWSTADSDATAKTIATLYANDQRIYENQFPQSADERLVDHEIKTFGAPLGGALNLAQRRDRVLSFIRNRPTLNPADMRDLISGIIGTPGNPYDWDYIEWNQPNDAVSGDTFSWSIGMSQLGYDSYLTGTYQAIWGDTACDVAASDVHMTDAQLLTVREGAGTIELRIYDDELSDEEHENVQTALDRFGRASRDHVIEENVMHLDAATGDFFLPMLDAATTYVHWAAEDMNTVAETIASRGNVTLTLTLNSGGTYTKPDTNHALAKGSSTKRKYISGTGLSSDVSLASTSALDLLNQSNVLTIEAVFRLQAYTAFYFRLIRSGVSTQRFDLYVGYDDTSDGFYFLPMDYIGGIDEGQGGLRTLAGAVAKGVVRVGEFCHFACMIDPRGAYPKFESYVNGEFIGRSQSTRAWTTSYNSNNETFGITDNAGDDTFRSFMEVQLHNTPLTLELARRKARYLRQLLRITEV